MAAPRASSLKALRNLQKGSTRGLHMTGVHAAPRPIDPTHKTAYTPWGLQDLRYECRKRTLSASGTKHELIDRLAAHDSLQARAFSMAMRRIAKEQTSKPISSATKPTMHRYFNTSRAHQAPKDSSTIDFAYLPKLFEGDFIPEPAKYRVPVLPNIFSDDAEARLEQFPSLQAAAGGYQGTDGGVAAIMKPQIETAAHASDANLSHMSDVGDAHTNEMSVETLSQLSSLLGGNAKKFVEMVRDKDESTIRKIWSGFLDDVFGTAKTTKS